MLTRGGRLELVRTVLSVIPVYYMTCFRLPQWVINRLDKIRRDFLWGKADGRGISLTNWNATCIPRCYGGLGISDLNLVNISLLLRWWWKAYRDIDCLWTVTICKLRRKGARGEGPKVWTLTGSFFWSQLQSIRRIFIWSTVWRVGDGCSISYWFDAWDENPRAVRSVPRIQQPNISLAMAAGMIPYINPTETTDIQQLIEPNTRDQIEWKWGAKNVYTASSAYAIMAGAGKIRWGNMAAWKCKAPPTVKIFTYLAMQGKILTRDTLRRRGMNILATCVMCDNCPVESVLHLLYLCPYATTVWFYVAQSLKRPIMKQAMTVQGILSCSWQMVKQQGGMSRKEWMSRFICVTWIIWKQRNAVVFGDNRLPPRLLAERCITERHLWLKYC